MSWLYRINGISLVFCTLLLLAAGAGAGTVEWTWRAADGISARADESDLLDYLENSVGKTEVAGRPALPLTPVSLAIPAGEKLVSLRLENVVSDVIELAEALPLFGGIMRHDGRLCSLPAEGGATFPADHIYAQGSFNQRGVATAEILIAPLLYEQDDQGVRLHRLLSADIVLETASDAAQLVPLRQRAEDLDAAMRSAYLRVSNPMALASAAPQSAPREERGVFSPRGLPSIEGSGVDLLIICAADHVEVFEGLAEFKLSMGIPTVVRDLDWISANYPRGADLQETIRFFLQDAYLKWGINSVLLAGDTDIIPARYIMSYFQDPPEEVPSELYYGALDGNWNADGDQYFGEAPWGEDAGDEVDILEDVSVGRLPVLTLADAELMVLKIITYSFSPDPTYVLNSTHLGEVLFPSTWQIGDPDNWITRNGADYCESVINNYMLPQMQPKRFYETYWRYDDAYPEILEDVIEDLNTHAHLVQHVGHGYRYTMSCGSGSLVSGDALAMTNGLDRLIMVYALNCTSCAVDYKCLCEVFLLAPIGGGIISVGTMRAAYPNTSLYYQNSFYEAFYSDSLNIGDVFSTSRSVWSSLALVEGSHRWTQMIYVLIGDPTINIWLDTPEHLSVALTEPFSLDSESMSVSVDILGVPVADAMVQAFKEGEDRGIAYTDEFGLATIDVHAESPGTMQLSVISRNNFPSLGEFTVEAGVGQRLSARLTAVVDDPGVDASIIGNADGLLDAGETVRLALRVYNHGDAAADNVILDLVFPNGELAVLESAHDTVQSIAAGDSLDIDGAFLITADWELPDVSAILFDLLLGYDGGAQDDQLDLIYHKPLPALLTFRVDDSSGNGDGQPDAGETYTLMPSWKNYGNTQLAGWDATLTAIDPGGTVISGAITLPELALLESAESSGFELRETDVATPNRFLLEVVNPFGGSFSDTITVRRPVPPAELILDASFASTIIDIVWDIPDPGDSPSAGYLVYSGLSEGGPYELVSDEPSRHAYFRSDGLTESTWYFFVVESVDSCGYRSVVSSESGIATNPSFLDGWPQATGGGSASSVVIGDIDGDGEKEMVAGSDMLYAWHSDGSEVIDGDENPSSQGVLNSDYHDFTASITLADVDTERPGLEIVAACIDPYAIVVFDSEGNMLPGWPKLLNHWCWATPAVADVDLDGQVEIFATCLNGKLYAWKHDGSDLLPGSGGVFADDLGGWARSSPALAQLDGDDELEIVVGSNTAQVFAWNHDGSTLDGWPVALGDDIFSSPSVGDIDDDGLLEIVVLCEDDSLYVINSDGSLYGNGFPVFLESNSAGLTPSAALVDFEDDGQMEIVTAGVESYHSSWVTIVDNQGNTLDGWPVHIEDSSEASPCVADLDNDGALEVLLGSEAGYLYGWDMNGNFMSGFPILTEAEIRGTPTLDDIDGNYTVELGLLGWDANVYIWDLAAYYHNGMAQWKMFRANPARTGVFTREEQVVAVGGDEPISVVGRLFANFPNPFNPTTTISFATPAGGMMDVKLTIHDVRGRRIKTLYQGQMSGGILRSVVWNGRGENGRPVASGVYFSRVSMGETSLSKKMVLLK